MKLISILIFFTVSLATTAFGQLVEANAFLLSQDSKYLLDSIVVRRPNGFRERKTVQVYDQSLTMVSKIDSLWQPTEGLWQISKYEYSTESNGNSSLIFYSWDFAKKSWYANYKTESARDSNGNLLLYINYQLNRTTNVWCPNTKDEAFTDEAGRIYVKYSYTWNTATNSYTYYSKTSNQFNTEGNLVTSTNYKWNSSISDWVADFKYEYQYTNGLQERETRYNWSAYYNAWIEYAKKEWNYNANGQQIVMSSFNFISSTNSWKESVKIVYTYDVNGNQDSFTGFVWDSSFGVLKEKYKYEYSFDSNRNTTASIYSTYDGVSWVVNNNSTYYYSQKTVSSVPVSTSPSIVVFPNPASSELRVRGLIGSAKFILTDLNGRVVLSRRVNNNETIPLLSIPKGVYIVHLTTGKSTFSTKITKIKEN